MHYFNHNPLGAIFSYDQPDQFTVAAVIRQALIQSEEKPYGGIPNQIWVDNGKDFVSNHVYQLTKELGIDLHYLTPHQPQKKGVVERFFGTLNTRLWSTLPGYVDSNVVERNPTAKAELTLSELASRFWDFIKTYHDEVHSSLGKSPISYWNENCFTEPVDPRRLDLLLHVTERRRILNAFIKFEGRKYWHLNLTPFVGEDVVVRAEPVYDAPDQIEVFRDGQWLCTAYAIDTPQYHQVSGVAIAHAQQAQKNLHKEAINTARNNLKEIDKEITQLTGSQSKSAEPAESPKKPKSNKPKKPSGGNTRKPDFLDIKRKGKE